MPPQSKTQLDSTRRFLFLPRPVQMMPNMIVTSAKRCQRLSCWHARRAFGIVKEIF
jgi:hypothetical protein